MPGREQSTRRAARLGQGQAERDELVAQVQQLQAALRAALQHTDEVLARPAQLALLACRCLAQWAPAKPQEDTLRPWRPAALMQHGSHTCASMPGPQVAAGAPRPALQARRRTFDDKAGPPAVGGVEVDCLGAAHHQVALRVAGAAAGRRPQLVQDHLHRACVKQGPTCGWHSCTCCCRAGAVAAPCGMPGASGCLTAAVTVPECGAPPPWRRP